MHSIAFTWCSTPPNAVVEYKYVGLRATDRAQSSGSDSRPLKTSGELRAEFIDALQSCSVPPRRLRWQTVVNTLMEDPSFAAIGEHLLREDHHTLEAIFDDLSSGHKLVLLVCSRLVELVDDRTLVLFDEPEAHLHPPLLSTLIRAVSELLEARNGFSIMATHSPVVLQEVPKSCVTIVHREGSLISFRRPSIETFGESIGTLTREVFRLETERTGFRNLIGKLVRRFRSYDALLEAFDNNLGSEARAVALVLAADGPDETGANGH